MKKEKKHKRGHRILAFVIVFFLLLSALCLWQRNNLYALYLYLTYDSQGVAELIHKNHEKLQKDIAKYEAILPRDLTDEEVKMLETGALTIEEAVDLILSEDAENPSTTSVQEGEGQEGGAAQNPSSPASPNEAATPPSQETPSTSGSKTSDPSSEIIRRYVAQIYSLKAYYMGQLNQIEARARSEYGAMTEKEKKNLSKATFAGKYIAYANSLLSECDAQMTSLLGEMKSELRAVGGDLSIITTIKQSYEAEKAAQKAYYMSLAG